MMKRAVFMVAAALALAACDSDSSGPDSGDRPPALFEIEYMNYAYLPTWKGFYIDASGKLYSYDRSAVSDSMPAERSEYTHAELMEKFGVNRRLVRSISTASLQDMAELIPDAAGGSVTEPEDRCADAGILRFRAFIYKANTGKFEAVPLRMEGDRVQVNESEAAETLYEWLDDLKLVNHIESCQP